MMKKDVLVTISGNHTQVDVPPETESEDIEVVTPGNYYFKNGKHYVLYEEPVEGMAGSIMNKIKIQEGVSLEIIKTGLTNSHMIFEKERIHVTPYMTPYGEILIGTFTKKLDINAQDDYIDVFVRYDMDVQQEKYAECDIRMNIREM